MRFNLDWSVLRNVPDVGEQFRKGMAQGRDTFRQGVQDNALAGLARNPQDADAMQRLSGVAPDVAWKFEDRRIAAAKLKREDDARGAQSDWLMSTQRGAPGKSGPQSNSDPAFERYMRADPSGAMKSLLEKQKLTKSQNEAMFTQMDMLGRLARGAVDQPSYDAARERAQSQGIDISSLPPRFDPAAVNAVELQAMSAKEYLTEQRNDRKFEWDVEDDQIDNTRADLNLDSQVETRQGQLANTRRGQDKADERGRRGQDLSDSRGRRGQDITDTRGRRGQDMGGRKPARGKSGGGDGAVIVNPQTGQRMKLQGGKWVAA